MVLLLLLLLLLMMLSSSLLMSSLLCSFSCYYADLKIHLGDLFTDETGLKEHLHQGLNITEDLIDVLFTLDIDYTQVCD